MEVHYQPHIEKKGFEKYFLEFLMIFLAVTLGLFAENFRENIYENKIAKNMEDNPGSYYLLLIRSTASAQCTEYLNASHGLLQTLRNEYNLK